MDSVCRGLLGEAYVEEPWLGGAHAEAIGHRWRTPIGAQIVLATCLHGFHNRRLCPLRGPKGHPPPPPHMTGIPSTSTASWRS